MQEPEGLELMSNRVGDKTQPIAGKHQQEPYDRPGNNDNRLIFRELLHDLAFLAQSQLP